MKNFFKKNKISGFTLIETLIYIGIFIILVGGIALFAANLQTSRLRAQILLEVNDQGASVVRLITQSIRNAESINSPALGGSAAALNLAMADPAVNPIIFFVSGENLYITEGSGQPMALTNNKVKITDLIFNNLSRPSTPGVVQFKFTLSNTASTTQEAERYLVDFYGAVAIRK